MPMFKRIRHSEVWKDKVEILKFKRIGLGFQCLKGYGKNPNVWKDNVGIPKF